jgi:hypothetical protein
MRGTIGPVTIQSLRFSKNKERQVIPNKYIIAFASSRDLMLPSSIQLENI